MIKYVNRIEAIEASQLSSATVIKRTGIVLPEGADFTEMKIVGLASIEMSDKISNKQRIFTTKLVAFLPEKVEIANHKLCFRARTVQNEEFLIGTGSRPFPVVELSDSIPGSVSTKCGCTLTVTYTSTIPMLSILR